MEVLARRKQDSAAIRTQQQATVRELISTVAAQIQRRPRLNTDNNEETKYEVLPSARITQQLSSQITLPAQLV
jgi:hypothetical protein